jgi:prepilin signal peptidase PulO-like enzyme (type II secretory pathway)
VKPFDNIPLLSFILLRGRCRNCKERISWLYPVVEFLTALLFVILIVRHGPSWETALQIAFGCAIIALIFIDKEHHLLPNMITYPLFLFALTAATLRAGWGQRPALSIDFSFIIPAFQWEFSAARASLVGGLLLALAAPGFLLLFNHYFKEEELDEVTDQNFVEGEMAFDRNSNRAIFVTVIAGLILAAVWAVTILKIMQAHPQVSEEAYGGLLLAAVGAFLGGGTIWWLRTFYFLIRGIEGMGLGDVKLMCGIGAFLGWQGAFCVLLIGSVLGAVGGAILAFRRKEGLMTALPFGLCLGIGALIVLLTR